MLKIAEYKKLKDEYVNEWLEIVKHDFKKGDAGSGTHYEVTIQNIKFECAYSDEEMLGIITTSIEIIRELIDIQANGYTREKFDEADSKHKDEEHDIATVYETFMDFKTDKLVLLIEAMSIFTRVGGAYFMFVSAPCMINTIYCVFERMLDDSDDEEMWFADVFFMIRGAMKMHSQELE